MAAAQGVSLGHTQMLCGADAHPFGRPIECLSEGLLTITCNRGKRSISHPSSEPVIRGPVTLNKKQQGNPGSLAVPLISKG